MSENYSPQLVLEQLATDCWRLCDRAAPVHDARHLVAYVERTCDGDYAVTWVSYGSGTRTFGSHRDILATAAELTAVHASRPGRKPFPIPHLPPLTAR